MTITFPDGIDLVGASAALGNYELYDPSDQRFEAATVVTPGAAGAFGGGTIDLTFGNLAAPGLLPGIIPGAQGDNITIRIDEEATIGNPRVPSILNIQVNTDTDTTPFGSFALAFGSRFTFTPNEPGANAEVKVSFYAKNDMEADDGKIIITFDDGFNASGFPSVIPPEAINLRADRITGPGTPKANQLVHPSDPPSFDLVGTENSLAQLKITIPDMAPDRVSEAANDGPQGIAENALITVTFSPSAGIKLHPEARTPFKFGGLLDDVMAVRITDINGLDTGSEAAGDITLVHLPTVLELNSDDGPRGASIMAEGLGFRRNSSVTVFLDKNGDGRFDVEGDSFLVSAEAGPDGRFSAEFTVDDNFSTDRDLNQVNAIDGEGNSVCRYATGSAGICNVDQVGHIVRFRLKESISVSPDTGGPVSEFHITFRDFPANSTISAVTLGGIPVRASNLQSLEGVPLNDEGGATIKALLPRNAVPGPQILRVTVTSGNSFVTARVNYTVQGPSIKLVPDLAVPNMDITITGSGFINGAVICAGGISIGGEALTSLPSHTSDGSGFPCKAGEDFVRISSGLVAPLFAITVPVPPVQSILDAGIKGDQVEAKVTDTIVGELTGVTATAFLEIPKRELTVSPPFSGTGSLLSIKGTGFPADNPDGAPGYNPDVEIRYVGDRASRVTHETPDSKGRVTTTLQVPRKAIIPSDNAIEATVQNLDGVPYVTTTIHVILGPVIQIQPSTGPSGSRVTIAGGGFERFVAVDSIEFGGRGVLGGRTITTDGDGNLLIPDVLVPGLELVVVDVVVNANGVTATNVFQVIDSGEGRDAPRGPVAEGLAPLGDSFERFFYFNNLTKKWTFFDPRPGFAEVNDLDDLVEGQIYWIKITQDTRITLNARFRNLLCFERDCWNQLVW